MNAKTTIDVRIVGIIAHVYPVLEKSEKHNFRQGLAGCWCEPTIHVLRVERIGMDIKTAVHQGVSLTTAHRILEQA